MDWFYNMEDKKRLLLAAVSWIPFFICICAAPEVFLVIPTLILAGVFTMLAAVAHDKEKKKAEAEKKAAEEAEKEALRRISLDEALRRISLDDLGIQKKAAEEKAARTRRFEEMQTHQTAPRSLDEIREENRVLSAQLEIIEAKLNEAEQSGGKYLSQKERQDLSDNLEYILKRVDELKQEAARAESSQAKPEFSIQFNPGSVNFPIYTKVKGVTFENRQAHLAESQNGDILIVRHAPLPKFPNAVEIVNQRTGKQLGFIGAELAQELIDEFGEGCSFNSEITEITGGSEDKSTLGCNLVIYGFAD